MELNIGDKVRFLNDVGGGVVSRFDGKKVYVVDEDGFEVPALPHELVVVNPVAKKMESSAIPSVVSQDSLKKEMVYWAIINENPSQPLNNISLWWINDTKLCSSINVQQKLENKHQLFYKAEMSAGAISKIGDFKLSLLDDSIFQIVATFYQPEGKFSPIEPIFTTLPIKASKFFKENSFIQTPYFQSKAVLIPLIKDEYQIKLDQLRQKDESDRSLTPVYRSPKQNPLLLEIDLHIHELIDDYKSLSNSEMLSLQLDKVNAILKENHTKGQKIVFIHGVGNGVLKNEVHKILKNQSKHFDYQDASFKEYGYGATLVIVK